MGINGVRVAATKYVLTRAGICKAGPGRLRHFFCSALSTEDRLGPNCFGMQC